MSDLISRKYVLQILKDCNLDETLFEKDVFDKIRNLPTAYSVANVVEELGKEAKRWEDSGKRYEDECEIAVGKGLRKAIEIVKHGGVSDDVCERRKGGGLDER